MPIAAVLIASALCVTPNAEVLLAHVQKAYAKDGDLGASFTQSYFDKLRGKERLERGTLFVKSDGRVRWSYVAPEAKDFVFDGERAFFYEPENAQVTVFDAFEKSPLWTALQLFWGRGDLRSLFAATTCDKECDLGRPGEFVIKLAPREPITGVETAELAIAKETYRVVGARIFDPLGNRTDYRFADFRSGQKLPDSKFTFAIPPGVSVLRPAASE